MHLHACEQSRSASNGPATAGRVFLIRSGSRTISLAPDRLRGDLQPPRECRSGSPAAPWRGVGSGASRLRIGPVPDRRGLAAVVGVRMRDHDQPHVAQREADVTERPFQLPPASRAVDPGVEQNGSRLVGDRPRVDMRHAGERRRQSQRHTSWQLRSPRPSSRSRAIDSHRSPSSLGDGGWSPESGRVARAG